MLLCPLLEGRWSLLCCCFHLCVVQSSCFDRSCSASLMHLVTRLYLSKLSVMEMIHTQVDARLGRGSRACFPCLLFTYLMSPSVKCDVISWGLELSHLCLYLLSRYGGISVGGVNSQVRLTETAIEAAFSDLRTLFSSFRVRNECVCVRN